MDFKATVVYLAPLTAAAAIAEQAVSPVRDFPDSEHPPSLTGILTLTPSQGSKCGPQSWSIHNLPKPKAPHRVTQQAVDSQSTRHEVEQGGSSRAASSKTQKKNTKKRQMNLKKHKRIRQVRDGHMGINDYRSEWWECSPDDYSPAMTAGQRHSLHKWRIAEPLPLLTPLPTESTAVAEQMEEELATEQRRICWRKWVAEVGEEDVDGMVIKV